jgi:hypothetical protein
LAITTTATPIAKRASQVERGIGDAGAPSAMRAAYATALTAPERGSRVPCVPARRALFSACLVAFAACALPAASSAHETVRIEEGESFLERTGTNLVIHGDSRPDLVTIYYDPARDEFIIGHDIEEPIPEGCYRDEVEPFHKLHCPAGLITGRIFIYTGVGSDKVVSSVRAVDVVFAALEEEFDSFEGGEEKDEVDLGEGGDRAVGGGGADSMHGGPGPDKLYGGPGPDRVYGGPGSDWLFGGPAGDFLFGGPDSDHCLGGPGKEHVVSCEIGFRY